MLRSQITSPYHLNRALSKGSYRFSVMPKELYEYFYWTNFKSIKEKKNQINPAKLFRKQYNKLGIKVSYFIGFEYDFISFFYGKSGDCWNL
jgi:hypothetical protein